MIKFISAFFLILIVVLFFDTCTHDIYNPDVCFQENVLPIFVSKCSMNGCHNTTEHVAGYDLSNYEGIMKGVKAKHPLESEVYKAIHGNNPSMPVGGKLDRKDITYIKIWIKMGAKNSSNCSNCDTSNYSYSGKIKPLFTTWCTGCHNGSSAGGGYDLTTYTGVVSTITDGKLLGSLKHSPGFIAMPQNTSPLSACDVSAVEKWVNSGYPNN